MMIYKYIIPIAFYSILHFNSVSAVEKESLPEINRNETHEKHSLQMEESKKEGHHHEERADQISPAGIMAPHQHTTGTWTIDFRYMGMQMSNLLVGSKSIGATEALWFPQFDPTVSMPTGSILTGGPSVPQTSLNGYRYMSVPKSMLMEMYMGSAMYGVSENTTLMFMIPVVKNQMVMQTNNLDLSNMTSGGVGDFSFSASHRFFKRNDNEFFCSFGISLPTGSTDETDWMPMMGNQKVPYNMQPGTGTISYLPGVTYVGKLNRISWGIHSAANLRSSSNEDNYRFGNRYEATSWIALSIFKWMSMSLRIQSTQWENIKGRDGSLDPKMDPQNDPNRQGGNRSDALIGINFLAGDGIRFGIEGGRPFHQHLNGPQLSTQSVVSVFVRVPLD